MWRQWLYCNVSLRLNTLRNQRCQGSGDRENPFPLALLGSKFISCSQGHFKTRKRWPQFLQVYWTGSRSRSGKSYSFTPAARAEYELSTCREKDQCCLIFFLLSIARILSDGKHAPCQGDGPHSLLDTHPPQWRLRGGLRESSGPGLGPGRPSPAFQMELPREAASGWLLCCHCKWSVTLCCDTSSREGEETRVLVLCLKRFASEK